MSAIVCGKRSFFEDLPTNSSSPSSAKRIRCSSSTSPIRSLSPLPRSGIVDKLREIFPLMDPQILEKALEECGDDIDAAIKRLKELCLGSSEGASSANHVDAQADQGATVTSDGQGVPGEELSGQNTLPADGKEWVELFVREMMAASSVNDARSRAARILEVLENSIRVNATAEAAEKHQRENLMLKEQIQGLMRENSIFKRAVQIQHERQKEFEDKNQEVQQLKQLLSQYQEQLRRLEVTNYSLTMHLRQAEQGSSIPGRFHPDIF